MRLIKGLLVGLVLAGTLAMISTPAAFAHGGGGDGHGGGFGGGHGGSFGGGGLFVILAGSPGMASRLTKENGLPRSTRLEVITGTDVPIRTETLTGMTILITAITTTTPATYFDAQASPSEPGAADQTNTAVQQELAKRGFYHGPIDGLIGPGTRKAISWFQSVEKLTVTGQVDDRHWMPCGSGKRTARVSVRHCRA